jgi:hypothetical protein
MIINKKVSDFKRHADMRSEEQYLLSYLKKRSLGVNGLD